MRLFEMIITPPDKPELWFVSSVRWLLACQNWKDFWACDAYQWLWDKLTIGFLEEIGDREWLLRKRTQTDPDYDGITRIVHRKAEAKVKKYLKSGLKFEVGFGEEGDSAIGGYEEFTVQIIVHETTSEVIAELNRIGQLGMR